MTVAGEWGSSDGAVHEGTTRAPLADKILAGTRCFSELLGPLSPPLRRSVWPSTSDLAKAAQNPIADMISVPFQNNFNFRVGPHDQLQNILNIQPVIPVTLNQDWNLITRWITPVISLAPPTVTGEREFGLGDINPSFSSRPSNRRTASSGASARPSCSRPALKKPSRPANTRSVRPLSRSLIEGPWVLGVLVNNVWSFAGKSSRVPSTR